MGNLKSKSIGLFLCLAFCAVIAGIIAAIEKVPWLLLALLGLAVLAYPVYLARRTLSLRRRGFFIAHRRGHPVIYEEMRDGSVVLLPISTAKMDEGCHHVLVPTRAEWSRTAPAWAKDRRDEIFGRILELRPKGWAELPEDWPG